MSFFKNILGSENSPRFRNVISGSGIRFSGNSSIHENVTIGVKYKIRSKSPVIGKNAVIRSNTIVYNDVCIGDWLIVLIIKCYGNFTFWSWSYSGSGVFG